MPRYPRNYIKTNYFHIMVQGINKNFIFKYEKDIRFYIRKMYELKQKHEICIIAYCIMSNHAHILLKVENIESLTKFMHSLNTVYAKYYNKKYNRVGYVFRNRYLSEGITNQKYLYNCIKYIHNNPVKANICKYPEEYPYSSYKKENDKIKDYDDNYIFMDIDEDKNRICKNIISEFLEKNNIDMGELNVNMDKLKNLIKILKDDNSISLRKIADNLDMNREKIRKIYKSIKKICQINNVPIDTTSLLTLTKKITVIYYERQYK